MNETLVWTVTLEDIVWDREVDGQIDEVQLPEVQVVEEIVADDQEEALAEALDRVSDIHGYLILDTNPLYDVEVYE